MTIKDIKQLYNCAGQPETEFMLYDKEGKPVENAPPTAEIDRLTWERKAYVGRFELVPLVKIYLTR